MGGSLDGVGSWDGHVEATQTLLMNSSAHSSIEIVWNVYLVDGRRFCNVVMRESSGLFIGDPDALTVTGLMEASIQDMLIALDSQVPIMSLSETSSETVFRHLRELRESAPSTEASFYAAPRAVESFDGEVVYLVRGGNGASRFIWQDFSSRKIRELTVDFKQYCADWTRVRLSLIDSEHTK